MFEVALWTRGFENFYCDLMADRPLAEALLDRLLEIKMRYWQRALELVGENVTIVCEADDLGGQEAPLVAPDLYREVIKPRHTKLFAWIRSVLGWRTQVLFCRLLEGFAFRWAAEYAACGLADFVEGAPREHCPIAAREGTQLVFSHTRPVEQGPK